MKDLLPYFILLTGYLIGAIPFGYLVARVRGVDIFQHGSGNIGATNVARVLGRKFGILVFFLDFFKGAGPVLLALAIQNRLVDPGFWTEGWLEVLTGLAAFLGHLFPVYLGFRGGKGVATGAGVVAVLFPIPALLSFLFWVLVLASTRYVSLSSILAVLVLLGVYLLQVGDWNPRDPRTLFCLFAGGLIVLKHRSNILRLSRGTENQVKENPLMNTLTRTLHVLALGLWFGMTIFFTFVVTLGLFDSFEKAGQKVPRDAWFPLAPEFSHADDAVNGPKEQGSRAAGYAVSPLFDTYFLLSGLLSLTSVATSLGWGKFGRKHKIRTWILIAGCLLVLIGWPIERKVHDLRPQRNEAVESYLKNPSPAGREPLREAKAPFSQWHLASVFLNLGVAVLTTLAMGLAAQIPACEAVKEQKIAKNSQENGENFS